MDSMVNIAPVDFSSPVVSLEMAKANANIQYTEQDDLLQLLLNAAIEDAEEYTSTIIQPRSVNIGLASFATFITLPIAPITGNVAVSYVDVAGSTVSVSPADFEIFNSGKSIFLKINPFPKTQENNPHPITITATAGYTSDTLPYAIKAAILLKFGYKEMYREDAPVNGNDRSFHAALRPYKMW